MAKKEKLEESVDKDGKKKSWREIYNDLKGMYAEGLGEIEKATKRFDKVRREPKKAIRESRDMNYGSMKVLASITLLATTFPGSYIDEIGKKALETFKEAYRKAPSHRALRGKYYSYKSNTKDRIGRLEDFMYNWWPKNKESTLGFLKDYHPKALRLADRAKAKDFATA